MDIHRLKPGRKLWLGGVEIPHTKGLDGHSDADVLIHAICDALLGAANLRDIGFQFPDTDPALKDIKSEFLLSKTIQMVRSEGYEVGNIDVTICAENPKINPYIPQMKEILAAIMQTDANVISIKATTSEKMGFVGREEGISAYAVVLIQRGD